MSQEKSSTSAWAFSKDRFPDRVSSLEKKLKDLENELVEVKNSSSKVNAHGVDLSESGTACGTLKITVHSAKSLGDKDPLAPSTGHDSYVRMYLEPSRAASTKTTRTTSLVEKSFEPKWEEDLVMGEICNPKACLVVKQYCTHPVSPALADVLIGQCKVSLSGVADQQPHARTLTLKTAGAKAGEVGVGEVKVTLHFTFSKVGAVESAIAAVQEQMKATHAAAAAYLENAEKLQAQHSHPALFGVAARAHKLHVKEPEPAGGGGEGDASLRALMAIMERAMGSVTYAAADNHPALLTARPLLPTARVGTPQGLGTVKKHDWELRRYEIWLDWRVATGKNVVAYLNEQSVWAISEQQQQQQQALQKRLRSGQRVKTPQGAGELQYIRTSDGMCAVTLDWTLANERRVVGYFQPSFVEDEKTAEAAAAAAAAAAARKAEMQGGAWAVGKGVETKPFGKGKLLDIRSDGVRVVELGWKLANGKPAVGYLQEASVELPAVPARLLSCAQVLEQAKAIKEEGTEQFKQALVPNAGPAAVREGCVAAIASYSKATEMLRLSFPDPSNSEKADRLLLMLPCMLNVSACHLRLAAALGEELGRAQALSQYQLTSESANTFLQLLQYLEDNKTGMVFKEVRAKLEGAERKMFVEWRGKAMFRLGKAQFHLGDMATAKAVLLQAAKLMPKDKEVRSLLQTSAEQLKASKTKEKAMAQAMFSGKAGAAPAPVTAAAAPAPAAATATKKAAPAAPAAAPAAAAAAESDASSSSSMLSSALGATVAVSAAALALGVAVRALSSSRR